MALMIDQHFPKLDTSTQWRARANFEAFRRLMPPHCCPCERASLTNRIGPPDSANHAIELTYSVDTWCRVARASSLCSKGRCCLRTSLLG